MPIFDNPNNPEQPTAGYYRWYFKINNEDVTLYLGLSGKRKTKRKASTLLRGVLEATKSGLENNTNYKVGTVINFIEENYTKCHWKHIDNNIQPNQEKEYIKRYSPILQDSDGDIKKMFFRKNGDITSNLKKELRKKWKHHHATR